MLNPQLKLSPQKLRDFCERWKIIELSLFGSVLREDFRSDSDVDMLACFEPDASWTLLDLFNMEQELAQLIGRKVDLVEKSSVEKSHNWIRRNEILETAQVLYPQSDELT